jgi:hypothetical protein
VHLSYDLLGGIKRLGSEPAGNRRRQPASPSTRLGRRSTRTAQMFGPQRALKFSGFRCAKPQTLIFSKARRCSRLEASLLEKAVFGAGEAEVFAQGLAFVFAAEEVAALEFGDDVVDEIVDAARDSGEHDVEAVAGVALEPLLHLVGDHLRGADHGEAAVAAGDLRQLADRQIVAPGTFDDALAAALAGIALRDLGQRPSRAKTGASLPKAIDIEHTAMSACDLGLDVECLAQQAILPHRRWKPRVQKILCRSTHRPGSVCARPNASARRRGGRGRNPASHRSGSTFGRHLFGP